MLLKATDRREEVEPMMKRTVTILLKFTIATGHEHPQLQQVISNYSLLLQDLGRSEKEDQAELNNLLAKYGRSLG